MEPNLLTSYRIRIHSTLDLLYRSDDGYSMRHDELQPGWIIVFDLNETHAVWGILYIYLKCAQG